MTNTYFYFYRKLRETDIYCIHADPTTGHYDFGKYVCCKRGVFTYPTDFQSQPLVLKYVQDLQQRYWEF